MKALLDLFWAFAQVGITTFGGGYAMLPILQREIVEKRKWATENELMDYYAIGQCTPGIIAANTATFIGYRLHGIAGAMLATMGLVFPSLVIITLIALFLTNFADIIWIKHAFAGIRVCVCVLILNSVMKLGKKSIVDYRCIIIFLVILALALLTTVSPVILVICAGLAGFLLKPGSDKEKKGGK